MESGESLFERVFSCWRGCNSLYFPLGNKIMECSCGECLCVHLFVSVFAQVCTQIHLWVFAFQFFCLVCLPVPVGKMSFLQGKSADGEEYWIFLWCDRKNSTSGACAFFLPGKRDLAPKLGRSDFNSEISLAQRQVIDRWSCDESEKRLRQAALKTTEDQEEDAFVGWKQWLLL